MRISERTEGDVLIISLEGRMTIGEGDSQAGDAIRSRIQEGNDKILLDMQSVPVLDSSGVGELIHCYTSANNRGGALKLLSLSPRVGEVLKSTQLEGIFQIFTDEATALGSF